MLITLPQLFRSMSGRHSTVQTYIPRTFTFITSSNSSSGIDQGVPGCLIAREIAALLTRMSILPPPLAIDLAHHRSDAVSARNVQVNAQDLARKLLV